MNTEATQIIKYFNLQTHPEGGYYARIFQSDAEVKSTDIHRYNNEPRKAGTSIYYLLNNDDFSAWHSIKSDEIWHYYKGSLVQIYLITPSGKLETYLLGDPLLHEGASFQVVIRAGDWFAAEVKDKSSYAFLGCTVSPGFEFKDFVLADREELSEQFPEHRAMIEKFTRVSAKKLKNEEKERNFGSI